MRSSIAGFVLISLICCDQLKGEGPPLPLEKRLVSADEEARILAAEELRELRRNIVKELVGVLAEHQRSSKHSLRVPEAMDLLGEMRIDDAEAIRPLVALISYPHFSHKCTDDLIFPQPFVSGGTVHLTMDDPLPRWRFPAVKALLKVGGPATPDLLRKLSDPELRFYEQKAVADVLVGTHGRQESSRLLGEARKAATSETSKKRIDETLRMIAGSKFESEAGLSDKTRGPSPK